MIHVVTGKYHIRYDVLINNKYHTWYDFMRVVYLSYPLRVSFRADPKKGNIGIVRGVLVSLIMVQFLTAVIT